MYVELPSTDPSAGWLAAVDEVAAAELRLKFPHRRARARAYPPAGTWRPGSTRRWTARRRSGCTAGCIARCATPGTTALEHHGFVNVLATRRAFDGAPAGDVVAVLEERDATAVASAAMSEDLAGARRWFTSFGSCSVDEPLDDLIALGLLEKP